MTTMSSARFMKLESRARRSVRGHRFKDWDKAVTFDELSGPHASAQGVQSSVEIDILLPAA